MSIGLGYILHWVVGSFGLGTITGPVSIGRVTGGSSHGGADRGPSPFGLHG